MRKINATADAEGEGFGSSALQPRFPELRMIPVGGTYAEPFSAGFFWLASNFSAKSRHAFAICSRRTLSPECRHLEDSAMHCPTYS
jgi:hypothetical protein